MFMAGIGRFDRIGAGANFEIRSTISLSGMSYLWGAMITAPTHMEAHPVDGQISQAVVKRLDAQLLILPVLRHAHLRIHLPCIRQIRVVDLEDEAGVDDGLVFFVHGVGDGEKIGLVRVGSTRFFIQCSMVPGATAGKNASATWPPWSAALKWSMSSVTEAWPTYLSELNAGEDPCMVANGSAPASIEVARETQPRPDRRSRSACDRDRPVFRRSR